MRRRARNGPGQTGGTLGSSHVRLGAHDQRSEKVQIKARGKRICFEDVWGGEAGASRRRSMMGNKGRHVWEVGEPKQGPGWP